MTGAGRMLRSGMAAIVLCGAGQAGVAQTPDTGDRRAPLAATVRFTDTLGQPVAQVQPGQPFRIELAFRSQTGGLPDSLAPMAWIRPRSPTDLACGETAAAYRASGRASLGSVDLNGMVLGVVARDGAVTVLDLQRSIGAANLLSAHRFDPAPVAMVADPLSGDFVLSLPGTTAGQGRVVARSPFGDDRDLATGLNRPGGLVAAASGGVWLHETGSGDVLRLGQPGMGAAPATRFPLNARAIAGDAGASGAAQQIAVLGPDRVTVLGPGTAPGLSLSAPHAMAVALAPGVLVWLAPDGLHVVWLDAPDHPQTIALPGQFDGLALSPQGRMAFVFSRSRTGLGVVDLALGRMVQGAATDSPVAEVAFLPDTAVLRLADQSGVGVMDLARVEPGAEAVIGHVALGAARPPAEARDATLLAPLLPEPAMLAVHAESYSGFVIDRRHAISGKPPMEALRLRGGIPRIAVALDQALQPVAPGVFAAATRLPGAAEWELVVSAGLGQLAFCTPVPTPPAPPGPDTTAGRISPQAVGPGRVRLRFVTAHGQPVAQARGMIELATLTGNWRIRQPFQTDASGLTTQIYDLSPHLPVVVSTRMTREQAGFAPLILEELP